MKSKQEPYLQVGVARRSITPRVGQELAGFDARKGVSIGVHDDLCATAVVFSEGDKSVALVSLDLIGITREFTGAVRRLVVSETGIAERDIILCATHTHCAPATIQHFYDLGHTLDAEYMKMLETRVVETIKDAFERRGDALIRSGLAPVEGVATNRRTKTGKPVDEYAGVVLVQDLEGRPKAVLVNYACHPTVLGPDTLEITRDFPNYLVERLEQHLGGRAIAMYFNGTEGDLSIGHKSDLSAVGVIASYRTFAKAKEVGERLAECVIASLEGLQPELADLTSEHSTIGLSLKTYPPLEVVKRSREVVGEALHKAVQGIGAGELPEENLIRLRQASLFARIDEYYATLYERGKPASSLPVEVSVVRFGGTALVFLPGELFVEIGLAIRKGSPVPRTMIVGLANDYIGYVHTPNADRESGYEVVASRVTPDASWALISEAVSLVKKSIATLSDSIQGASCQDRNESRGAGFRSQG